MSEHTKTPWLIVPGKAFIYALDENGVNRFQASIDGAHCPESELVANARHIVHCVNNHERLVEMVGALLANPSDSFTVHMAESLIADMEAEKGGEL